MEQEQLLIKGVDVAPAVSIQSAVHDMHSDGQADTLRLICNDDGTWSKWGLKIGDEIQYRFKTFTTGKMYVRSLRAENGMYTVFASSCPPAFFQSHVRKWKDVSFLTIARQIASEQKLSFKEYGVSDQTLSEIEQEGQSDLSFLYRLASLMGCSLLVFDSALVLFGGAWQDTQSPLMNLEIGENGKFVYIDQTGSGAGSVIIRHTVTTHEPAHIERVISGSFSPGDGLGFATIEMDQPAQSDSEAMHFARGIARSRNAFLKKGRFTKALIEGLAPGSVISITTPKAGSWNGPAVVYRVRNDYVQNSSTVFFRHALRGY